jgi:anti-anti-sigma factor
VYLPDLIHPAPPKRPIGLGGIGKGAGRVVDHIGVTVAAPLEAAVLVSFSGDIDALTHERFSKALREAIVGADRVINVDLSQVKCIASEGVNALLGMHLLAAQARVSLRIIKASENVQRVLDLMGLTDYLGYPCREGDGSVDVSVGPDLCSPCRVLSSP